MKENPIIFVTIGGLLVSLIIKATQKASVGMYSLMWLSLQILLVYFLVLPGTIPTSSFNLQSFFILVTVPFLLHCGQLTIHNIIINVFPFNIPPCMACPLDYQLHCQWLKLPWSDSVLVYFIVTSHGILYQSMMYLYVCMWVLMYYFMYVSACVCCMLCVV